jgi:Tol biopolymer transport system component
MLFRRRRSGSVRSRDSRKFRPCRRLAVESLESRRLLTIDLVSGVTDPALVGDSAHGASDQVGSFALSSDGRYAVFASTAADLVPADTNQCYDVFVRDLQAASTRRVSTDSTGAQAAAASYNPALSADGRYVAFESSAANLVEGDTNGHGDIFVKDLTSGATRLATSSSASVQANGTSSAPALTADGRYVTFSSYASNLVDGDTNGVLDVFVKDLTTGATRRVSTDSTGAQANGQSVSPAALSADGRYVAFASYATNLVTGDTNAAPDVFVKDLTGGATIRVSSSSTGQQGDGFSESPTLSADGRYVAFASDAANLVTDDANDAMDIFVKDITSGIVRLVSSSSTGTAGDDYSYYPAISADGRCVTYFSDATSLVSGDNNSSADVFVTNLTSGITARVSTDSAGAEGLGYSEHPALSAEGRYVLFYSGAKLSSGDVNTDVDVYRKDTTSGVTALVSARDLNLPVSGHDSSFSAAVSADGRYVAFYSYADNLVAGDTNGASDVFMKDMASGAVRRVSTTSAGAEADSDSYHPAISADGRYVAFQSGATNLVAGDTNDTLDVFVTDLASGAVSRVSTSAAGREANNVSQSPAFSADGRYVAFVSLATNLVANDTNGVADIFVKDLASGAVARASTNSSGAEGNDASDDPPALSADGRYVVFTSLAQNLVPGDANKMLDVFVKDLQSGQTVRASVDAAGGEANAPCDNAALSADGRYVAFSSGASNLVPGDTNTVDDIFVKDLVSGAIVRASTDASGAQANEASPGYPALSATGLCVVFRSAAANLVPGDTNGVEGIFVKNLATGAITRVGSGASGTQGFADEDHFPAVSADGRYVVFQSDVDGLVPGDGNRAFDVFRAACPLADQPPTDITLASLTVPENEPVGTQVGTLATLDPDAGDRFTYTFATGAGDTDNGSFTIAGNQLRTAVTFDFESQAAYRIRIRTTDLAGAWYEERFTVQVADVNEGPTDIVASGPMEVPENSPVGTVAGSLVAQDPDSADSLVFTLLDSAGGRFALQGSRIVVADRYLLDHDTQAAHTIRVRVTDQGDLAYNKDFTLAVTDVHDFDSPGLYDPAGSVFYLRSSNTPGFADYTIAYGEGNAGWQTLAGDWNGDGSAGLGLYAPATSTFYLANAYHSGYAEYTFGYGQPDAGWIPLVGDWNGDGQAGVGLYDPQASMFYLTNSLQFGFAEHTFAYGQPGAGWIPLVGDWNGDGRTGVGLFDPQGSTFYLTNTFANGFAEYSFGFGMPQAGWQPLVGDWNGDRADGVGLFDPQGSTFYLTNALATGFAQYTFGYGQPDAGWRPLVGDWNGDRAEGVGLFDPSSSTFLLTNTLAHGFAEYTIAYGQPQAGWVPIAGCWTQPAAEQNQPTAAAIDRLDLAELAAPGSSIELDGILPPLS